MEVTVVQYVTVAWHHLLSSENGIKNCKYNLAR